MNPHCAYHSAPVSINSQPVLLHLHRYPVLPLLYWFKANPRHDHFIPNSYGMYFSGIKTSMKSNNIVNTSKHSTVPWSHLDYFKNQGCEFFFFFGEVPSVNSEQVACEPHREYSCPVSCWLLKPSSNCPNFYQSVPFEKLKDKTQVLDETDLHPASPSDSDWHLPRFFPLKTKKILDLKSNKLCILFIGGKEASWVWIRYTLRYMVEKENTVKPLLLLLRCLDVYFMFVSIKESVYLNLGSIRCKSRKTETWF